MAGQGFMFNPLIRSGFQKKEDLLNIKIFNLDGSETTITEIFRRIDSDLSGKVDKSQGTAHSGMVLYVNDNGYVDRRKFLEITPAEREKLANLPTYGLEQLSDTPDTAILCSYQLYKVENGRKTYIGDKVNIPRDLFLEDVSVLDVSDEHPLPGYENGRYFKFVFRLADGSTKTTILPVSDLSPCVDNGHHTKIEDLHVNVYDLVPQYSNINDVLDHEKVIQYIGDTTEKFTHGYFYERQLVSKPVEETLTFQIPTNTKYIEILEDGHIKPKGNYYLVPNSPLVDYIEKLYDKKGYIEFQIFKATYDGIVYLSNLRSRECRIGDKVWLDNFPSPLEIHYIVAIHKIDAANTEVELENGVLLNFKDQQSGSYAKPSVYANANGDYILYNGMMGSILGLELVENHDGTISVYSDGVCRSLATHTMRYTTTPTDVTITYTIGQDVYDWVRIDVQPSSAPYDPSALENRVENLETDSHKQNTDTALADNKLYISSSDGHIHTGAGVGIISESGIRGLQDIWAYNGVHKLSQKLNSSMQRTYATTEDLIADMSNIPEGAWCAIINTHSTGVSAQSDDDIIE